MRLTKLPLRLAILTTVLFSNFSFSQESVIEFEDHTKMKFRVLDNTPERQKPGIMRIGLGFGLNYQYWKRDKFVFDAGATTQSSIEANFLYGLIKSQKEKKKNLTLKSVSSGAVEKHYVLKDVARREDKFWGVHVNAEYFYKSKLANFSLCQYLQTGIGLGRFKVSHIRYYVSEVADELKSRKESLATRRSGLYMDFLYFVNPVYYGPVLDPTGSYEDPHAKITNTGFQVYWDVSTQKQMNKRRVPYGICWRIGAQSFPRWVGEGWGKVMLKFGVGVSF